MTDLKTQLTTAMKAFDLNKISAALDNGADINLWVDDYYQTTPLIWAAGYDRLEISKFLIEKGANLDLQDRDGDTALMLAAHRGHEGIVRALTDKGANLHLRDNEKRTALDWAHRRGNSEIAAIIEEALAKEKSRAAEPEKPKPKTVLERIEEQRQNSTFTPPWGLVGR